MIIAFLVSPLSVAAARGPEAAPDEIVVRAIRGKCTIVRAGVSLGDWALDAFAKGWPQERPLRIISPGGADYRCLAKIAFELQRKGIRHIEFVDPPTAM